MYGVCYLNPIYVMCHVGLFVRKIDSEIWPVNAIQGFSH